VHSLPASTTGAAITMHTVRLFSLLLLLLAFVACGVRAQDCSAAGMLLPASTGTTCALDSDSGRYALRSACTENAAAFVVDTFFNTTDAGCEGQLAYVRSVKSGVCDMTLVRRTCPTVVDEPYVPIPEGPIADYLDVEYTHYPSEAACLTNTKTNATTVRVHGGVDTCVTISDTSSFTVSCSAATMENGHGQATLIKYASGDCSVGAIDPVVLRSQEQCDGAVRVSCRAIDVELNAASSFSPASGLFLMGSALASLLLL